MAARGILGRKIGMTQVWDADHRVVPVTVIQAGPCRVVQLKTPERDGYAAVQLAFGATKAQRLSKPELGHLERANGTPTRHLAELRVNDLGGFEIGQVIAADVFEAGERVDVTGMSKGKGFAGVMKRHNFKGQGASHGNHKKHRAPGAIGACATPARVFKGMRMAGQHGDQRVTTLNLEVVDGDAERGLLLVRGSVPGPNGGIVFVRTSVKGAGSPHPVLPVRETPVDEANVEVVEDTSVEEAEPEAVEIEQATDDADEAPVAEADEETADTDTAETADPDEGDSEDGKQS